ncbi:MAG TPA: hypothetical protein VIY48_14335 [Candidatus Paceibacterota bacterium]
MVTYQPRDITVLIVDVAEEVRDAFGGQSFGMGDDYLIKRELRLVASASDDKGNFTQITFAAGEALTAEEIFMLLNQRGCDGGM